MFDFLEELAAIISEKQIKCKNCGYVREIQKESEIKDIVRCPKCGKKDWEETSLMEGEI
ncbi:hypothetical protein MYX76_10550 [Desulfobacterota bacterium AH_259_B03_O07]|nr:hypothetical protein [Desulfobacterota bacterium AH_259_B03_O07]